MKKAILIKSGLSNPFGLPVYIYQNLPVITFTYFGTEDDELLFESCLCDVNGCYV